MIRNQFTLQNTYVFQEYTHCFIQLNRLVPTLFNLDFGI